MRKYAFDLDDTLINSGQSILKVLKTSGLPINDYREPYRSLYDLVGSEISKDDCEFILNRAYDTAEPIEKVVSLLNKTINRFGYVNIVSTRSYINPSETLNILGSLVDDVFAIKFHWCKAMKLEEHGDAKLYTWNKLVDEGVTHFFDDLGFNIATIIDKCPKLTPVMIMQPWGLDRRYVPWVNTHPKVYLFTL